MNVSCVIGWQIKKEIKYYIIFYSSFSVLNSCIYIIINTRKLEQGYKQIIMLKNIFLF